MKRWRHNYILFSIICGTISLVSATAAYALDIAYSQGTISVSDSRKVTVGAGGNYTSCEAAVNSFARGGQGGIIEFLPGIHETQCGSVHGRGTFLITGRLGPNGERPIVTPENRIAPNGAIKSHTFLGFGPKAQEYLVVENLEIRDSESAIDAADFGGVIIRNVFVNGTRGESGIAARQPSDSLGFESWMEIYDTEVARAGSNNIRHNLYLNRIGRVYIDGLDTHSALNSHALKIVARDVTVVNSTLSTTKHAFKDVDASDPYLSTTLLDIAACSNSVVNNNTFVGGLSKAVDRSVPAWGESTAVMIDVRRRRTSVQGCDDPVIGSAEYEDPEWWKEASANGYKETNEYLMHHDISNNTFINDGDKEIVLVYNKGTAPIEGTDGLTNQTAPDLLKPEGWFERSLVSLEDNTIIGNITDGPTKYNRGLIYQLDDYDVVGIPTAQTKDTSITMSRFNFTLQTTSQIGEPTTLMLFISGGIFVFFLIQRRQRSFG